MSSIYLYAEILANIRQVSLFASLQTAKNEETRIDISSDRRIITVLHDGEKASLFLPTGIGGSTEVTIPVEKKKEVSLRLEIDDVSDLPSAAESRGQGEYPWPAEDLSRDTKIRCVGCGEALLGGGAVDAWKDLPSEGWAEMVDLWHCHKPHEHRVDDDTAASSRGLAPASKIKATRRTGLVDVATFLVHPESCINIRVSKINSSTLFLFGESPLRSLGSLSWEF